MTGQKRRKKKKSRNKFKRDRVLLDTSVQIRKTVDSSIRIQLQRISSHSNLFSSYLVLYEFKVGFIKVLIDFYLRVKICGNVSDAIASWSNSFKMREIKNKILLEALMLKFFNSIDASSVERYLAQIEAIIFNLLREFYVDLKGIVGSFSQDEIVQYDIRSREDYEEFLSKYNSRKCIPLSEFCKARLISIEKILNFQTKRSKSIEKICNHLESIKTNVKNADKYNVNRAVGDAVIAIDCPSSFIIASLDSLFEFLCRSLDKKFLIIQHSN